MVEKFFGHKKPKKESVQFDPKSSAEEFAQAVMATIPYHETFGNATAFFLNLDPTPKQPEYQDKLRERIQAILQKSKITPQFSAYITAQLLMQHQIGIFPSPEYSMEELAGVDLQHGEYGIFDPPKAKTIEGALLKKINEGGLEMMTATAIAKIDLSEWRKAFKKLHK